ncbi:hypothetical protein AGDE_06159 [Angomonas deanei]|nr:hypothetical protein AGDE_06159 [Angomonas deanei]|eukprot:EPY37775.1 hypothetical protein AGDE_06159 [Angomonas deanei]
MHQFGHVYALQQELLDTNTNDWFRAVELWHTARQEGVAMNNQHFSNILRQCVSPGAWEQSLQVLKQMKRENIRPDVVGVGSILASLVEGGQSDKVEELFNEYSGKMLLDSVCYLALIKAKVKSGDTKGALEVGKRQEDDRVPSLPYTYITLLDAAMDSNEPEYVLSLMSGLKNDNWQLNQNTLKKVEMFGKKHQLELELRRFLNTEDTKRIE